MQRRAIIAAAVGGGIATAIDVVVLAVLVHRGAAIPLAAFSGAACGAAAGFTLNKYVAFRDRSRLTMQQCARFGIVAVATALLMAVAMQLVAVDLGVPYLVAKLVCAAVVFVLWTFPAQRRLVFAPARSPL